MRNCAKMALRDAPRAVRTAISFWRVVPLASSRLATLTQAISSTKPTAPSSIHSIWISSLGRKSLCSGSTNGAPAFVAFWIGLRDVGRHRVHVGLRLLDGDAGLQAAHGEQPVEVVIELVGLERERDDEPLVETVRLTGCEHADHGVGGAIELNGLADDVRIGAEPPPELVHQDDYMLLAERAFFGKKVAAIEKGVPIIRYMPGVVNWPCRYSGCSLVARLKLPPLNAFDS